MNSDDDIIILACGDILLADFYFDIGVGMGSLIAQKGPGFVFEKIQHIFQECDLLVGNLESPIGTISNNNGIQGKEFLASPQVAGVMNKAGFQVLSIANNHISQHGHKFFEETIQLLNTNGIEAVGVIYPDEYEQRLICQVIKGKRFGFLAYSLAEDHFETNPKYYAYQPSEFDLLKQVERSRKECDFLIVMLHWGEEFINLPAKWQVALARKLTNAGCDVILGSHSHIVQGVDFCNGKVVAYSLGNFIFSMPWKPTRASGILELRFGSDGLKSSKFIPIWIDNNNCPVLAEGKTEIIVQGFLDMAQNQLDKNELSDVDYSKLVKRNQNRYRVSNWFRFIQNIFRMPYKTTLSLLVEFIQRKIEKISH